MRKHFPAGVVALTLLVIVAGALTLYAGDGSANGENCVMVDGVCELFDKTSGTLTSAWNSLSPAFFSLAGVRAQLTSAGFDPGQCEPMTPEQCAAAGYEPGNCIRLTPDQCAAMGIAGTAGTSDHGKPAAGIFNVNAKAKPASAGCNPGQCEPMTPEQCAAAGCEPGNCIRLTPDQCAAMGIAGTAGMSDGGDGTAEEVRRAESGTSVSDI